MIGSDSVMSIARRRVTLDPLVLGPTFVTKLGNQPDVRGSEGDRVERSGTFNRYLIGSDSSRK